ncbi:MAG: hypothetical protein O9295_15275 [Microcystis sp. LE18-22.4A]|uniref:hypothetical protein n=1 Tax=Microcystis sp. LE18-22.4A TaxID=3016432 RepID=UPI0011BDB0AB|nr:hypothetical protein [Microcystis sp. LE18-22.4A]MCZ8119374.1 hypothetical protein [Microcystis sp. LE18-22.4A]
MSSYVKNIKLEAFSHQFFVMPTTAQEVYNQVVCHLSSGERLRLATIITWVDWRFSAKEARIKLKQLYPSIQD